MTGVLMRSMARCLAGSALLWIVGCDTEERPARWSYIHTAIIAPACTTAGCHSGLTAMAGLNLSDREGAYTVLTGRICGEPILSESPPRNYVEPFNADGSQLVHQLRGDNRDVMPPDTPLPDVEIELVERWIDEGAACE